MKNIDRCSRIAELLLLENEIKKIENCSDFIRISEGIETDILNSKLTPIEKVMYAILSRISYNFMQDYSQDFNIYFQTQQKIDNYIVDFLVTSDFSKEKIIIECDGHDFHEKTKEQAQHDKERDRFLTSKGYIILRYTGSEIYNNFCGIESELSKLLDVPTSASLFKGEKI